MARLMVYDGYCHLCSGWAQFMSRHPIEPPFTHLTMQSEAGQALGLARAIPKPWRDALYRVLARNRYRWFGRRAQCHVPSRDA